MTASAGSSPMTDGRARPERTCERARLGRDAASGARRERRGREETRRVPRVARGGVRRGARARRVRRRTARGGGRGALPAALASFPPRGRSERKPVKRRSVGGPSMQREVTLKAAATSLEADPRARRPASRAVPPRRELARPRPLGRPLSGSVTSRPRTSRSSPRFGRVVVARGFAPGRGASSLERPVRARVSGISPDASSAAASRPRVAGASPRRPRAPTWPPSARSGTCSARR